MKKLLLWLGGIALAVFGIIFFVKKGSSSNNAKILEGKKAGQIPLSDQEASNLLNAYSDLPKYYSDNYGELKNVYPDVLSWVKWWWANYGYKDNRSFESPAKVW